MTDIIVAILTFTFLAVFILGLGVIFKSQPKNFKDSVREHHSLANGCDVFYPYLESSGWLFQSSSQVSESWSFGIYTLILKRGEFCTAEIYTAKGLQARVEGETWEPEYMLSQLSRSCPCPGLLICR
jgi:hypothetical protein